MSLSMDGTRQLSFNFSIILQPFDYQDSAKILKVLPPQLMKQPKGCFFRVLLIRRASPVDCSECGLHAGSRIKREERGPLLGFALLSYQSCK